MKQITAAVKLVTKFVKIMVEHAESNSVPKKIPPFSKSIFVEQNSRNITIAPSVDPKTGATWPAVPDEGGKRKSDATKPGAKRKKRETSNKSLKMGLFHVKKGTPVANTLPNKTKLKDGEGICMDFCAHKRKCNFPHQICKNGKHYTNWKKCPQQKQARAPVSHG
jgi:hypothetical protein